MATLIARWKASKETEKNSRVLYCSSYTNRRMSGLGRSHVLCACSVVHIPSSPGQGLYEIICIACMVTRTGKCCTSRLDFYQETKDLYNTGRQTPKDLSQERGGPTNSTM